MLISSFSGASSARRFFKSAGFKSARLPGSLFKATMLRRRKALVSLSITTSYTRLLFSSKKVKCSPPCTSRTSSGKAAPGT